MLAKRKSCDGDHRHVRRKLQLKIQRPASAMSQVAEESQALAAQSVVEPIQQRGQISREQPLGHRRAIKNPAQVDPCRHILECICSIRLGQRHLDVSAAFAQ